MQTIFIKITQQIYNNIEDIEENKIDEQRLIYLRDQQLYKHETWNSLIRCQYQAIFYFWIIVLGNVIFSDILFLITLRKDIVQLWILFAGIALYLFQVHNRIIKPFQIFTATTNIYLLFYILAEQSIAGPLFCFISILLTFVNLLCSIKYLKDPTASIAVVLVGVQEFFIACDLAGWGNFGNFFLLFLLILLICVGIASALSVFSAIFVFGCIQSNYFSRWNVAGMIYLCILLLCLNSIVLIPLGLYFMDWPLLKTLQPSIILCSLFIIFSLALSKEVLIFFCDSHQIFEEHRNQQTWIEVSQNYLSSIKFKLISQNFGSILEQGSDDIHLQRIYQRQIQVGECLICCDRTAQILNQPCGHIALCQSCHLELFNEQYKCILCKQFAKEIYLVKNTHIIEGLALNQNENNIYNQKDNYLFIERGFRRL